MFHFLRFLHGSQRLRFASSQPERILDLTHRYNIPIWRICAEPGAVSFSLSPWNFRRLKTLISLRPDESLACTREGILVLWDRFGKRPGLFLGTALFLLLSVLSSFFIWSVEVEGNAFITEGEICEKLEVLGLRPGVPVSRIDKREFSLLFQVKNPEFSFASLNIIGTRAILSVRERESVEEEEKPYDGAANLVSSVSGEILRYEVLAGQIAVKRGDIVPKGSLLISGVVEKANGAFITVEAKGRVFAKTHRYFEVTVPFSMENKIYTGEEKSGVRYEFMGISVDSPLFSNAPFEAFDTTDERERVTVLGRSLPIVCHTRTYHETEEKISVLTVDRAKDLAYDKYEEFKREVLLPDYEILEEKVELSQTQEGITLGVELVLCENIALLVPFSCTDSPVA